MSLKKGNIWPWVQPYTWDVNYHGPYHLGKYLMPYGLLPYGGVVVQLPFGPISDAAKLDYKTMQWTWTADLSIPFLDLPTVIRYSHATITPDVFINWRMVDLSGGTFEADYKLLYDNFVWVVGGGALPAPSNLVVTGNFGTTGLSLGFGFATYFNLAHPMARRRTSLPTASMETKRA